MPLAVQKVLSMPQAPVKHVFENHVQQIEDMFRKNEMKRQPNENDEL